MSLIIPSSGTSVAIPGAVGQLIEEVRQLVLAGKREEMNKLGVAIGANAEDNSLSMEFTTQFGAGSVLSIDLEDIYVWRTEPDIGVERAMFGSLLQAHAAGAFVYVDSKFSPSRIFRAFNFVLDRLNSPRNGLFRVATVDITYDAAVMGYNLTGVTDLLGILEVEARRSLVERDYRPIDKWRLGRLEPTSSFASGYALYIEGGQVEHTQPIRITYRAPFIHLNGTDNDVDTQTGLPATAQDLLVLGAAVYLTAGREVARNFDEWQGDTRRQEEVPPGANLQAPNFIRQLWRDRVQEEAAELQRRWPARKSMSI